MPDIHARRKKAKKMNFVFFYRRLLTIASVCTQCVGRQSFVFGKFASIITLLLRFLVSLSLARVYKRKLFIYFAVGKSHEFDFFAVS